MSRDELSALISPATRRNWARLATQPAGKLTSRANKRQSRRRIFPVEYLVHRKNIPAIQALVRFIEEQGLETGQALLALGRHVLDRKGLLHKRHVACVLDEYDGLLGSAGHELHRAFCHLNVPGDEYDVLGAVYQCLLSEGEKNSRGSYYTPLPVVRSLLSSLPPGDGQDVLDPCCGSGAILLSCTAPPQRLHGVDSDATAVMLAKINLLLKHATVEFVPRIYCLDYLEGKSPAQHHEIFDKAFDVIVTNPPWGARRTRGHQGRRTTEEETFALFFRQGFEQLRPNGTLRFLFPEAVLQIAAHRALRQFMVKETRLVQVTHYDQRFAHVATGFVDVCCQKAAPGDTFVVHRDGQTLVRSLESVRATDACRFTCLSELDQAILALVRERGVHTLKDSLWALGVVTGDNKGKLFRVPGEGMEAIYTGRDIEEFVLKPASRYILYKREALQQVAREELYRAPEKLVYRFISGKLVFAYDDRQRLVLNSANILIPRIPGMSMRTVLGFLNSSLFQFVYKKRFGDVKILKSNLLELAFPRVTPEQDAQLAGHVEDILQGRVQDKAILDDAVFALYACTRQQIEHVLHSI